MTESIWRCPVCNGQLNVVGKGFACELSHQYDRAKQGYVNLLLANQKRSRDPGDGEAMVQARRRFLATGHYQFLADALAAIVCDSGVVSQQHDSLRILDLGCGEGYYLDKVVHACSQVWAAKGFGIDISKSAVKRAASGVKHGEFAVASNYHIPVLDEAIDVVLSIFSPLESQEVRRVLHKDGRLIRVSAGANHLKEIKQAIYPSAKPHLPPKPLDDFELISEQRITRRITLEQAELSDLVGMTPLQWRGDDKAKADLLALPVMGVECDFIIQVFKP